MSDRIPGDLYILEGPDNNPILQWKPTASLFANDDQRLRLAPSLSNSTSSLASTTRSDSQSSNSSSLEMEQSWIAMDQRTPKLQNEVQQPAPRAAKQDFRELYSLNLKLTDIRSIHRHMPALGGALGWPFIVIVISGGVAMAPLYFHAGGMRELFRVLREHTCLFRSSKDPTRYDLNDDTNPLQKSLYSLDLGQAASRQSGRPTTPKLSIFWP